MKPIVLSAKQVAVIFAVMIAIVAADVKSPAAEPERVAVLPFAMNAQQDLTFLQKGIVDMLSSRISQPGTVDVIPRDEVAKVMEMAGSSTTASGALDETKARIIGANLGADYVLFGSLTLIGDSSSLDGRMVHVAGEKPTVTFFDQGTGLGNVIPQINTFATDINKKLFDRQPGPTHKAVDESESGTGTTMAAKSRNPSTAAPGFTAVEREGRRRVFTRHINLPGMLNGLAVGDVDGDGLNEIVTVTDDNIIVIQADGAQMNVEATIPLKHSQLAYGVDVADINGNGIPEIFITCLNTLRNVVNSFVLEYTGSGFGTLVSGEPWYYRVVKGPGKTSILLGQKQSSSPYKGDIYEMNWEGSSYLPGSRVKMVRDVSVMSLAMGDLVGRGDSQVVFLSEYGQPGVVDSGGKQEWQGSSRYGGSLLYYLLPRDDPDGTFENRVYFQPRLKVFDLNRDGIMEVIAVNNHDFAGELLAQRRHYTKGNLEILSWDGLGLSPMFKTTKVSGCIADFDIADFNNDSKMEMIVAIVIKAKGIIGSTPKSTLISYELD